MQQIRKRKAGEDFTDSIYQNEILLWVFQTCSELLIYFLMKVAITQETFIDENSPLYFAHFSLTIYSNGKFFDLVSYLLFR